MLNKDRSLIKPKSYDVKTKVALDNCTVSSWATFDRLVTFRGKTVETFILLLRLLSRPILKNA